MTKDIIINEVYLFWISLISKLMLPFNAALFFFSLLKIPLIFFSLKKKKSVKYPMNPVRRVVKII